MKRFKTRKKEINYSEQASKRDVESEVSLSFVCLYCRAKILAPMMNWAWLRNLNHRTTVRQIILQFIEFQFFVRWNFKLLFHGSAIFSLSCVSFWAKKASRATALLATGELGWLKNRQFSKIRIMSPTNSLSLVYFRWMTRSSIVWRSGNISWDTFRQKARLTMFLIRLHLVKRGDLLLITRSKETKHLVIPFWMIG